VRQKEVARSLIPVPTQSPVTREAKMKLISQRSRALTRYRTIAIAPNRPRPSIACAEIAIMSAQLVSAESVRLFTKRRL
jgi:hypothetical protein